MPLALTYHIALLTAAQLVFKGPVLVSTHAPYPEDALYDACQHSPAVGSYMRPTGVESPLTLSALNTSPVLNCAQIDASCEFGIKIPRKTAGTLLVYTADVAGVLLE